MRQINQILGPVEPGTLMQKVIPPRLVEPYLTGRRAVIAGFVYRAQDSSFTDPASSTRSWTWVTKDQISVRTWRRYTSCGGTP